MSASTVRLLRAVTDDGRTDAELLGRYVESRDEYAFALLVRRHGAMVYGVCRRILPTAQDAEDAFQATFLVLVEKARSAPREAVGNWLYGVSRRAALMARRTIMTRRETEMGEYPAPEPMDELRAALDEELSRLPEVYRTAIVLCDLEGRTRREAAGILGWPEGTVAGRLVRAREMLAKRLARHAPAVSVAAVLSGIASARVPEVLPPAAVPAGVAALTREVLAAMSRGKLMKAATVVLLMGCVGLGMVVGQNPAPSKGAPVPPGASEAPKNPPKADDVAWGKEVDGLQIGLGGVAPTYRHGETAKLEVRLRNVGKADVKFTYVLLREHPPQVTAADGARMSVAMPPSPRYYVPPTEKTLKPGETVTLYNPEIAVEPEDPVRLFVNGRVDTPTLCASPGKFKISFGGMIQSHPKLATGMVEFEVKDPVAWGKEVGGIQAGIVGLGPVRIGEKARLAVRLRNVSKEAITLSAWPLWYHSPRVVDAAGKPVRATSPPEPSFDIVPTKITLKPGETADLDRADVAVEEDAGNPVKGPEAVVDRFTIRVRPGTYKASFTGFVLDRPTLSTGTVEFEVQEPAAAFTAWGKEVGGLQAGLGFRSGEKRAYGHGETVKLVLRVRNVGKDVVEFKHIWAFFVENPPTVTDAEGKTVELPGPAALGAHLPRSTEVAPGKEVDLYEWEFALRAKGEGNNRKWSTIHGTGKFGLQCERVVGPTKSNPEHPNPAMSKLATGKLDLEVTADPPAKKENDADKGRAIPDAPTEEARKDIKEGELRYFVYGQPRAHDVLFAEMMKKDHSVALVMVGCTVSDAAKKQADEYNGLILAHLEKNGKKDIVNATEAKARKQWEDERRK